MDYWGIYSGPTRSIRNLVREALQEPLVLIDGGGAGELPNPFRNLSGDPKSLKAFRFEPRIGTVSSNQEGVDEVIPYALWSEEKVLTLNITASETSSSVLVPNNMFLKGFASKHKAVRDVINRIDVPAISLDALVKSGRVSQPDFIKLDIHGAELDALKGSRESIRDCLGVVVEGWHQEVHIGQGLMHEVHSFLYQNGFELYDNICSARWTQNCKEGSSFRTDRSRYVGSEALFIRREATPKKLNKKILILILFGFSAEAEQLLTKLDAKNEALWARIIGKFRRRSHLSASLRIRQFSSVINSRLNGG